MKFEELYLSLVQSKPDLSPEAIYALANEHYSNYKRFEKGILTPNELNPTTIEATLVQALPLATGAVTPINVNPSLVEKYKADFSSSIGNETVICCFCGMECKVLTEKHLKKAHGLTKADYLTYFGQPINTKLTSLDVCAARSSSIKAAKAKPAVTDENPKEPM